MVNNALIRENVAKLQEKGKADREWWDKERASIQSKFMQELEEEKPAEVPKEKSAPSGTAAGAVNSDEDAVLVEGGGPAASGSTTPGAKGGTKKRKGKK